MNVSGAGKTTLAEKLLNELSLDYTVRIFTYDKLILPDSDLTMLSWKHRRQQIIDQCRQAVNEFKLLNESSSPSTIVLIDDNMYLQSMRYTYYQLARSLEVGFCQIFLDSEVSVCWQRVSKRNEISSDFLVPRTAFDRMRSRFEKPDPMKNKWEHNSISISISDSFDDDLDVEKIENVFQLALRMPLKRIEVSEKIVCGVDSFHHQADLLLRNLIKEQIQNYQNVESFNLKNLSKEMTRRKKILLDMFRYKSLNDFTQCCNDIGDLGRSNLADMMELLDWPLNKWDPPDICKQIVAECFHSLKQEAI